MDSNYFTEYYTLERNHWWFRARSIILENQVRLLATQQNKKIKILNVGVATGSTSEMLAKYGEVTSVEYDHECCLFLKSKLGMEVIEASVTALPFQNDTFDLVCAFDVIEHVEEDQQAVNELKRVCKADGHVFCTVPAFRFLWSNHDDVNHHIRRYTAESFRNLFLGNGNIIFSSYFNFLLFIPVTIFRLLSKLLPGNSLRSGAGSDFTIKGSHIFSPLFFRLFKVEDIRIRKHKSLPFGISYLLLWSKNQDLQ